MGGIKPTFNIGVIQGQVDAFVKEKYDKSILILQKVGEDFVDSARSTTTYKDRTRNLRGSIGYAIYHDGKRIRENYEGQSKGVTEAKNHSDYVALGFPKGFVLIGVAGMKYARYVEAKGYDVITGSEPTLSILKEYFDEI